MKLPRLVRQIAKRVVTARRSCAAIFCISTDYQVLAGVDDARRAAASSGGWLAARTVTRQERAYRSLIAAMKRGEPRLDFTVAAEAVAATGIANPRLLEVGCGSGYYSEVFADPAPGGVRYTGIDYSEAMIARARARYPSAAFEVADATRLPYADGAFDIVFNGVSLMHIIDYQAAIREAARVAGAILHLSHRAGVRRSSNDLPAENTPTARPSSKSSSASSELMSLCRDAGLRLERKWPGIPYDVYEVTGHHSTTETYLFATR